jgi:hypothetical protein
MSTNNYYPGQRVLIEMTFRLLGIPTDPTIVQMQTRSPSGTLVTLTYPAVELTRRDIGLFEAAVLVDEPGQWNFRGIGVGVIDSVQEASLDVQPSGVM